MKVFIFILISIYSFSYSKAQLVKQWDNRFGGTQADLPFSNIIETKNGYLLSGWSYGDSSYDKSQNNWSSWPDFWIVKSDLYGNKIWDKRFGGYTAEILYASSMAKDGGYLLGGYS
ncbi:MAG: hypothetical protein LH473_07540, partial [Chitinophagales bacterium]|nr:hypothetical protein [Chitinophagales bacterium]